MINISLFSHNLMHEFSRRKNMYSSKDSSKYENGLTGGDATIIATTFNIAKSIIGAGVLSLPSGIAFFADSPSALIPASFMCVIMGLVAAYSYSLIGKACEQHNAKSFREVWEKSVDPKTAWIVSGGITAQCFLSSLAFSIIIGDSLTSIATSCHFPNVLCQRHVVIVIVSTFVLYPLCSLKSLNSLANFSLLGLSGTLYTALFMALRYFDGSYAPGGAFFKTLSAAFIPQFNVRPDDYSVNHLCFVLLSMLSTAFVAHYNAPKFYAEMKETSSKKFSGAVNNAFGLSIAIFIFIMSMGFLTFGGASSGFVLNNYASTDSLASLARLSVAIALITSYPFPFTAMRDGIMDLGKFSDEKRMKLLPVLTISLLIAEASLAIALKDVGFVVSISGAMFGSSIMFIIPAIMNLNNSMKSTMSKSGVFVGRISRFEAISNRVMMAAGVLMAVIGAVISTLRQFSFI